VATATVADFLTRKVPRDHRETDEAYRRRRRVVTGVSLIGAGMLGASLSTKPGSTAFYVSTLGVAGTWVVGGFASDLCIVDGLWRTTTRYEGH
jgi:hypothetical protein